MVGVAFDAVGTGEGLDGDVGVQAYEGSASGSGVERHCKEDSTIYCAGLGETM